MDSSSHYIRIARDPIASHSGSMRAPPTVFVVHDEAPTRSALELLIGRRGWEVQSYCSARAFMPQERVQVPSCLLLALNLPDRSGLEVQQQLLDRRGLPVIFVSGCGDIVSAVRAMKAGAVEFLVRPFSDQEVLNAVEHAIERSTVLLRHAAEVAALRQRYLMLSPREREVMELVISGRLNKEVAGELGLAEVTIKTHRGKLMRKMGAGSLAELVKMYIKLRPEAAT
jgi:FixJ family two-component response regulator